MAKFNKGDKVRVKTLEGYSELRKGFFEVGGIYEVKGYDSGCAGGNVYFSEDEALDMALLGDDLELVTEANAMTTFKKGDVVVTVKKAGYAKRGQGVHYAGAIGKVKSVNGGLLTVKFDKQQPNNRVPKQIRKNFVVSTSEIRLATADEAASVAKKKAEQPTFKVGDKVRMLSDSLYGKKYKGNTGVVFECADEDGDISVTPDGGGARGLFKADSLELLTEKASVTPQVGDVVTFEGFDGEYRKVDRKAQAGDVVVLRDTGGDLFKVGNAYKVVDGVQMADDDGDLFDVYRDKIRRTPETVDVYEKVEAKYVPQEGDIVVVTSTEDLPMCDYYVGDTVKIVDTDRGEPSPLRVIKPNTQNGYTNVHSIRKATPAEVEAYEKAVVDASKPKLNVGDTVKLIKSDRGNTGEYAEIIEVGSFKASTPRGIEDTTYRIRMLTGKDVGDIFAGRDEYYAKATEQEVADATKPKFKAGDFVTIDTDRFTADITPGKVYEVFEDSGGLYFLDDVEDERYNALEVGAYTIVDADEAKWAQIGRKVGEYKVGDVVEIVNPTGAYGKCELAVISEITGEDIWYENKRNKGGKGIERKWHTFADFIELIAPVESLFNA